MSVNVLFSAGPETWEAYKTVLPAALTAAGVTARVGPDIPSAEADYIVYAPDGGLSDFTPYRRARAVLSLWAGVEKIVGNPTLTLPLARMVDQGLRQGMVEWVTGHVLRHHLGMDRHILDQSGTWLPGAPPLAQDRPVTVLGFGALGAACGQALAGLGFPVTGWSHSPKTVPGIRCLHGADGLDAALRDAQIVVLLLPQTPETENLLNDRTLALPARGVAIVNPGRGPLIDDAALIRALDSGQVGHATLDVFRVEPLPADHPFWAHPRVTVTPHIASETRPGTAAAAVAQNIARAEAGQPLLHLVDRTRSY